MIGTPIRWLLMAGVAACGFFMIASSSQSARAMAFVISVLLWQAHYVVLFWEADFLRGMGAKAGKHLPHDGESLPLVCRLAESGVKTVELGEQGSILRTWRNIPSPEDIRRTGWLFVAIGGQKPPSSLPECETAKR